MTGSEGAHRTGIRGIGQSTAVSIGGTPARGLVFGGTLWTARIDPVFVEDGRTVSPDDDSVKVTLARIGPFVDWYPDPSRGLHVQASAALALAVEADEKGDPIEPAGGGAGVNLGAGYEWFVSDEVSLGLLGRVGWSSTVRKLPGEAEHTSWRLPELLVTATYH